MSMWQWIKKHPQRTAGLLLALFGSVEGGLVLFQTVIPPLWNAGIKFAFGTLTAGLAWAKLNLKDEA